MMPTHGTFGIDSVPAPSPFDPVHRPRRRRTFKPFVGVVYGRLVTIIGKTTRLGMLRDEHGCMYDPAIVTRDLDAYAEMVRADAQDWDAADLLSMQCARGLPKDDEADRHDTQQDSLGTLW